MYSLRLRLPPEQNLAHVINSARTEDQNVDYVDEQISSSVFTENHKGWSLSRSCIATLDAKTGKFDVVMHRDHQGWRRALDFTRLNRIFRAVADPQVVVHETLKTGVDFREAIETVRQFEIEAKARKLPVHESAKSIHIHYTFAQALLKDGEAVDEVEPEAFINRPEPKKKFCCRCDCR